MIWFKFYSAWGDGVQELSDAEAGRFIKALCACAESKEIPTLSGAEKVLYAMASQQLKRDTEHNAKVSASRADAGRIGGLASKQTEANASKTSNCLQNEAKQANANNCSIKNKELRSKKLEEEVKESEGEKTNPTPKMIKHRHGNFQHVFLTDDEFSRIQTDFPDWQKRIQKLDDYLENNPSKHYANHNLTIRNWANRDAEEAKQKQTVQIKQPSQNKTAWEMLKEKGVV